MKNENVYRLEGGKLVRKARRFWVMAYEQPRLQCDEHILITDEEFWIVAPNVQEAEKILDTWVRGRAGMKTPQQIMDERVRQWNLLRQEQKSK